MRCLTRLATTMLVLVGSCLAALAQAADETPKARAMLVLDASGSMWGQINGTPKIVIARQTIADLVGTLDPAISLGLSAYGHRREGDCNDIETLRPVGSASPEAIVSAVNSLNPKGKTPLSESVRRAAQELNFSRAPATVILVSDGLENCAADPCAVAAELEAQGIDFTAHVIGFDLKDEEQQALRCVAENTGGMFLSASDAGSLASALGTVVAATSQTATAVAAPPPPAEEGIEFEAFYSEGGEKVDIDLTWEIFEPAENEDLSPLRIDFAFDDNPKFDLEPGRYLVRATVGGVTGEAIVQIEPDTEDVDLVLDAGIVTFGVTRMEGGELIGNGVNWIISAVDPDDETKRSRVANAYEGQPVFTLKAGAYVATARIDAAAAEARFTVAPGERKTVTLRLASGVVGLRAVLAEGGDPLVGDLSWSVREAEPDADGVRKEIARSSDSRAEIELPVGQYLVTVSRITMQSELPVVVEADQRTDYTAVLNAGILTTRIVSGFPLWRVYATDADGNRTFSTTGSGVSPNFTVPAGTYTVEAVDGTIVVSTEVTIQAGEMKTVELAFAQ